MAKTKVAFPWYGGKANMAKWIWSEIKKRRYEHRTYVEVFGGAGAVLMTKDPSPVEVFNDIDEGVVNFFRVLRDEEKFERFRRLVELTPYSRKEYDECKQLWEGESDDVVRAWRWYVVARMSIVGKFGHGWGYARTESVRGMSHSCSRFLSSIENLPEIAARLKRVQIECLDFRDCIQRYDTEKTLFYLDPTYVPGTCELIGYRCSLTRQDHEELVKILLSIQGKAVLSGYPNDIYEELERNGWERVDRERAIGAEVMSQSQSNKRQYVTDSLWFSPNMQVRGKNKLF